MATMEQEVRAASDVTFTQGGVFYELLGAKRCAPTNVARAGDLKPRPGVIIDGFAEGWHARGDLYQGRPVHARRAGHPEWERGNDPVSRPCSKGSGAQRKLGPTANRQRDAEISLIPLTTVMPRRDDSKRWRKIYVPSMWSIFFQVKIAVFAGRFLGRLPTLALSGSCESCGIFGAV